MLEDIGVKGHEDNDKNIVIESNSDEVLDKLEALNIRTTTLDDGKVTIVDNSDEVRRKIEQNSTARPPVASTSSTSSPTAACRPARPPAPTAASTSTPTAASAPCPTRRTSSPAPVAACALRRGETGWEAYIPGADSKRGRSTRSCGRSPSGSATPRSVRQRRVRRQRRLPAENAQISNLPADPGIPLSSRRSVNPLAQLGEGANRLGVALGSVGSAGIDFLASSGFAKDSIADLVRMNGGGGASGSLQAAAGAAICCPSRTGCASRCSWLPGSATRSPKPSRNWPNARRQLRRRSRRASRTRSAPDRRRKGAGGQRRGRRHTDGKKSDRTGVRQRSI
ncbi:hypothetical protein GS498_20240 [Rhodococcus hoagii]|nr:hypothetical protein [Prescottella equi]